MEIAKKITMVLISAMVIIGTGCSPEDDPNNGAINSDDVCVTVTTYAPQDITSTTAVCGGEAAVTQGDSLTELGVCWGLELNPAAEDNHCSTTNWNEPFFCTLTDLEPGKIYHVRAFALYESTYYYGEDKSFTTESNGGGGNSGGSTFGGHEYVDLGLPSGIFWATCNVGAEMPEDFGNYFAWGERETEPKTYYDWTTYKYCIRHYNQLTKYCNSPRLGYNGYTDPLTTLEPLDDAARFNWGNGWRMPTYHEWVELYENTTNTWTTQNGVNGMLFIASNGNSLFLPAAGCWHYHITSLVGTCCYYWSSSLYIQDPDEAWCFSSCIERFTYYRYIGQSVRAVHEN